MAGNSILIIKHGAFGDFVQALGAMKAIRAHHADATITLMTTKPFVALAQASGYVDHVYVDTRPKWFELFVWLNLRAWLNAQEFSYVYDLQNSDRTTLYARLFTKLPGWSGIAKMASHRIADDAARKAKHAFKALCDQLRAAGIGHVEADDLTWIESDVPTVPVPYVLVVPGCSPTRLAKRWAPENYIAVCRWLVERGYTPVLIGTKDEADVTAAIKAAVPSSVDLTGQTSLMQIAVLARKAAAAVGNDTGPIQMIGPTGCKTLGLYPGFAKPQRYGALGVNVRTLQGETMADITVDEVRAALTSLVA